MLLLVFLLRVPYAVCMDCCFAGILGVSHHVIAVMTLPPVAPPHRSSAWAWEHQVLLLRTDGVAPLRAFMLRMLADKTLPRRGDVDILTGGPPCQVSTLQLGQGSGGDWCR